MEPEDHVLEVFALGSDRRWVLLGTWTEDAALAIAPFEGTTLALDRWWLRDE